MLLKVSPQPDGIVKSGLSRLPVKEKNTGSNPVIIAREDCPSSQLFKRKRGTSSNNSVVECLLAKQNVVSSNLTCCSKRGPILDKHVALIASLNLSRKYLVISLGCDSGRVGFDPLTTLSGSCLA